MVVGGVCVDGSGIVLKLCYEYDNGNDDDHDSGDVVPRLLY